MRLAGLVPFSLQDYPGKASAVVFAIGCGLRCPYCHNPGLSGRAHHHHRISEDAFLEFLGMRRGLLSGVVVTGGEPTDQEDLPDFLGRVRRLGFQVKLDTNGTRPFALAKLLSAGLVDYVAMDLKDLPEEYPLWLGGCDPEAIEASLGLLRQGAVPFELRTTVVAPRIDRERLRAMSRKVGRSRWYLQAGRPVESPMGGGWSPPDPSRLRSWAEEMRGEGVPVEVREWR